MDRCYSSKANPLMVRMADDYALRRDARKLAGILERAGKSLLAAIEIDSEEDVGILAREIGRANVAIASRILEMAGLAALAEEAADLTLTEKRSSLRGAPAA